MSDSCHETTIIQRVVQKSNSILASIMMRKAFAQFKLNPPHRSPTQDNHAIYAISRATAKRTTTMSNSCTIRVEGHTTGLCLRDGGCDFEVRYTIGVKTNLYGKATSSPSETPSVKLFRLVFLSMTPCSINSFHIGKVCIL